MVRRDFQVVYHKVRLKAGESMRLPEPNGMLTIRLLSAEPVEIRLGGIKRLMTEGEIQIESASDLVVCSGIFMADLEYHAILEF